MKKSLSNKSIYKCNQCGTIIIDYKSKRDKNKHNFCSKECSAGIRIHSLDDLFGRGHRLHDRLDLFLLGAVEDHGHGRAGDEKIQRGRAAAQEVENQPEDPDALGKGKGYDNGRRVWLHDHPGPMHGSTRIGPGRYRSDAAREQGPLDGLGHTQDDHA